TEVTSPCSIWDTRATLTPMAAAICLWPRPSCLRVSASWCPRFWASSRRAPASISAGETPAACMHCGPGAAPDRRGRRLAKSLHIHPTRFTVHDDIDGGVPGLLSSVILPALTADGERTGQV